MQNDALIVFTAKSIPLIERQGGTSAWVLSPASMRGVRYVVCTRNADRKFDEEFGVRTEAHGEAFLVGKVSGLKQFKMENNRWRYLVQMSKYALVSVPDFWTQGRNPTRYTNTKDLRERGIDVDQLEWLPMPQSDFVPETSKLGAERSQARGALTIAEAKRGLSLKFDVPEKAIQIIISG